MFTSEIYTFFTLYEQVTNTIFGTFQRFVEFLYELEEY